MLATTSEATQVEFTDGLLALGFDETGLKTSAYSATTTWTKPGAAVSIRLTVEEVSQPGVDDLLRVSVDELEPRGWPTGVEHVTSHLARRNLRAVLAFIAAIAEEQI